MQPHEYVREAFATLQAHRLRSMLTMLGIIVGVLTVVLTLGVGAGAQQAIDQQIRSLGSNLIVVNSGPPPGDRRQAIYLYAADARAVRDRCPLVAEIAPQQETRLPVAFGSVQLSSNFVMGVTASYATIRGTALSDGRFLNADDDVRAAKVAVVGSNVGQYLFGNKRPTGKRLLINGVDFEIVGLLAPKGDSPGLGPGMSTDDRIFIPLTALQKRLLGTTDLRLLAITAQDQATIPAAVQEIRAVLDERHPRNPFEIKTQLELMQTSQSVSSIVGLLLTSLAAVSLVVGGIGIMNIMLVSVTERTREIGIRRAVGARESAILLQFLAEAVVLSSAGGLVGVTAGVLLSWVMAHLLRWSVPILPQALLLALLSSTLVGITSGLYPARRASTLNVSEALRFE
jgi:ABC-type antimicrobial peptide transport system permease subunit